MIVKNQKIMKDYMNCEEERILKKQSNSFCRYSTVRYITAALQTVHYKTGP
jgi:hypothetical protein